MAFSALPNWLASERTNRKYWCKKAAYYSGAVLEEISYNAPDLIEKTVVIDAAYVDQQLD